MLSNLIVRVPPSYSPIAHTADLDKVLRAAGINQRHRVINLGPNGVEDGLSYHSARVDTHSLRHGKNLSIPAVMDLAVNIRIRGHLPVIVIPENSPIVTILNSIEPKHFSGEFAVYQGG